MDRCCHPPHSGPILCVGLQYIRCERASGHSSIVGPVCSPGSVSPWDVLPSSSGGQPRRLVQVTARSSACHLPLPKYTIPLPLAELLPKWWRRCVGLAATQRMLLQRWKGRGRGQCCKPYMWLVPCISTTGPHRSSLFDPKATGSEWYVHDHRGYRMTSAHWYLLVNTMINYMSLPLKLAIAKNTIVGGHVSKLMRQLTNAAKLQGQCHKNTCILVPPTVPCLLFS